MSDIPKPGAPSPGAIVWFEIPALDLDRAVRFYTAVFGCAFKREDAPGEMPGKLAIFDFGECRGTGGALMQHPGLVPSSRDGVVIYLAGGPDLAESLGRVEAAGGSVLLPKMAIGPYGFIAHFRDSEGNRIGLHAMP